MNASNNNHLILNNAVDIGSPIAYIDRGNINLNDPTNYYRLRLNENGILDWQLKDFNGNLYIKLIKDFDRDNLVSFDDVLESSLLDTGKASEWFVESGEYFIQIERFSTITITDYTFQLNFVVDPNVVSIDLDPGNNFNDAFNLGSIATNKIIRESINSSDDPLDYYRFKLDRNGTLNWQLRDMEDYLYVRLIKDLDGDSLKDDDEILESSFLDVNDNRELPVEAGEYFIEVEGYYKSTDYTLQLDFIEINSIVSIDPGNSLNDAFNLGNLDNSTTLKEFVGTTDRLDYYNFNLDRNGTLSWQLQDTEEYLSVKLIKDLDGDYFIDDDELLEYSYLDTNEEIEKQLEAGEYFIEIERDYSSLNYNLQLDFEPISSLVSRDPSENPNDAFYLGNLTANRTLKEFIGAKDSLDYYKFRLDRNATVNWKIQDSEDGISVKLIKDIDGDKIIDDREILNYSFLYNNEEEEEELAAGEYLLEVSGSYLGTNYTLQLDSNLPEIATKDRAIFDIDGSGGEPTFARDSLLLSAAMFYYKAERTDYKILDRFILDNNASRKTGNEIINYLQDKLIALDIDGSGNTTFARDALLISAYMFYYKDDRTDYSILDKFILDTKATRKTGNEIVNYIQDLIADSPTIASYTAPTNIDVNSTDLIGNDRDDILIGYSQDNLMVGNTKNDILTNVITSETLRFDLEKDNNKITDINATEDAIDIDMNLGFASDERSIDALQYRDNLGNSFGSNDRQIDLILEENNTPV